MALSERLKFALVLSGGVILPGLADYALSQAGFHGLGMAVWVAGYIGAILLIWVNWVRPLDLTGPS
ncbi:MAG: hypothetical protein ABEI77_07125 [Halorientalis sp.]